MPGIVAREVSRRVNDNLTSADDPEPSAETVQAPTQFGAALITRSSVPSRQGDT
jgi:hypothetical protein